MNNFVVFPFLLKSEHQKSAQVFMIKISLLHENRPKLKQNYKKYRNMMDKKGQTLTEIHTLIFYYSLEK